MKLERGGESIDKMIATYPGWRRGDLSWRGSMWSMPPRPRIWMQTISVPDKRRLGLAADALAIRVRGVFGPAGRRAGIRKGDVVVEYDGCREHLTAEALHTDLRLRHYRPGAKVPLVILRGEKRLSVTLGF